MRSATPRVCIKKRELERSRVRFYSPQLMYLVLTTDADFTGVSAPYEAPEKPEIHIRTDQTSVIDAVQQITEYLSSNGYLD